MNVFRNPEVTQSLSDLNDPLRTVKIHKQVLINEQMFV